MIARTCGVFRPYPKNIPVGSTEIAGVNMADDPHSLDRFDHAIIAALSAEGRMPVAELARRIGLSKSPTAARLARLERAGIIRGYRAMVDPVRLGLAHVAFVEVRLADTREPALRAFNEAVRAIPEIESCHMIAGSFDYLLKVRTADMGAYRQVMAEHISALPHVMSTSTHVAMQAVRDDPA